MKANTVLTKFHSSIILIHWVTFFLLIAVYALIELRGIFPKGSVERETMKMWHFMLGLTVFLLLFIRLFLRWKFPIPPIIPDPPQWQKILLNTMHWILYIFLFVMPLLGWLTLSAKGKVIPFFGLQLPTLIGIDKSLGSSLQDAHETVGIIGYYIIGVHTVAALFHHYFMRDNALLRMLPWGKKRGKNK